MKNQFSSVHFLAFTLVVCFCIQLFIILASYFELSWFEEVHFWGSAICLLSIVFVCLFYVTKDKQFKQLKETEYLHSVLLYYSQEAILGLCSKGTITFTNPAAERILGYSQANLLGMNITSIVQASKNECSIMQTLRDANSRHIEDGVFIGADKSSISVDYMVAALQENTASVSCVVMFNDITRLKQKEKLLANSEKRLRKLNHYQEQAIEEERRHIAREVHDELGQLLTVLRMDVAMLNMKNSATSVDFSADINRIKNTVDSCISAVRQVASSLRPKALDLGLVAATDWLLKQYQLRSNIQVIFNAPKHELQLSDIKSTAAFRVIQESLTNISRHANASQIIVTISTNEAYLLVKVEDDGQGFDSNKVKYKPGFGLMGMRERVMVFGGSAHFDSVVGKGTVVCIKLPLHS